MTRRSTPRLALCTVALVGVVAALVGCTTQTKVALPAQNIARWVMPLDRFFDADDVATNYAEILLMGSCMTDAGFIWDVPWTDPHAGNKVTASEVGIRIFNVDIAKEFGYRSAPNQDRGAAAWTAWAYRERGGAEVAAIERCTLEVRKSELPLLPGSAQLGNSLVAAAYDAAEQDGAVGAAAKGWRSCMGDVGIPDLPSTPNQMPSRWLSKLLNLGDPHGVPSAEEIRYATKDATCRDSSGYIDTFYQVLWDKEAVLVQDNADALLRIEVMVTKHREKVADIISRNAPPAP
ncbi:hypothetical protein BH09ACT4_BH09ACT4_03120 [soil metagenome]